MRYSRRTSSIKRLRLSGMVAGKLPGAAPHCLMAKVSRETAGTAACSIDLAAPMAKPFVKPTLFALADQQDHQ